jgi:serine/threonine-protein kinase
MPVGDDDTIASTLPSLSEAAAEPAELVANRYRIARWLGTGGMGRVYEALDTELGERVALKVLRAGLSEDAIERFRREVRLTRRIQHPNVARMFDIGESLGQRFLTMELVAGESLLAAMGRPMEWTRLKAIALQICAGLAAAHDKGVVHRDLKPDNILIERGTERAVLTDFGIARSIDDAAVTQVGSVVGTPRYMAPEQLAGREVDHRADVFALGVILYELAAGNRPWSGENPIAIAVAQATQPLTPLRARSVPDSFAEIVTRCLALEPADRPASAREVADAIEQGTLDRVSTPAMTIPPPLPVAATHDTALAVLPFSCGPGDEYLADGLHEDVIDTLSGTTGLRVRPGGIVRSHAEPDPIVLGRRLEVDHVVVGSLRRTRDAIRVSARLIGVADGFQIFAHKQDCSEAEILGVSESIARGIAAALSTRAATATRPTDPRAVDLYLRARSNLRLYWASNLRDAADLLDDAFALSPTSTQIAGTRAYARTQAWVITGEIAQRPLAEEAIATGLATGHAEAYLASAQFKFNTGESRGAIVDLATALIRGPMLAQAHEMAGRILVEIDAVTDARNHLETSRALDPARGHLIVAELARLDALEGWWDRADRAVAAMIADREESVSDLGHVFAARLAGWRGQREEMLAGGMRFAARMGPNARSTIGFLRHANETGRVDVETARLFIAGLRRNDHPLRGKLLGLQIIAEIALVHANHELAIEALTTADELGLIDIVVLTKCPLFDPIADLPAFREIRARVAARAAQVLAAFRAVMTTAPSR